MNHVVNPPLTQAQWYSALNMAMHSNMWLNLGLPQILHWFWSCRWYCDYCNTIVNVVVIIEFLLATEMLACSRRSVVASQTSVCLFCLVCCDLIIPISHPLARETIRCQRQWRHGANCSRKDRGGNTIWDSKEGRSRANWCPRDRRGRTVWDTGESRSRADWSPRDRRGGVIWGCHWNETKRREDGRKPGSCLRERYVVSCSTLSVYNSHLPWVFSWKLDTSDKLPAMLAIFAVLASVHPHTIKPFLPSFLSWRNSHEKRY